LNHTRRNALVLCLLTFWFFTSHQSWARSGTRVLFILDESASMGLTDLQPSRLGLSKIIIRRLAADLEKNGFRFGLLSLFGSRENCRFFSRVEGDFSRQLQEISPCPARPTTPLGRKLAEGILVLGNRENSPGVIILLTDGNGNSGELHPVDAARLAAHFGVSICCLGTGTGQPALLPVHSADDQKNMAEVEIPVDRVLMGRIASLTGGLFIPVTGNSIHDVMEPLRRHLLLPAERLKSSKPMSGKAVDYLLSAISGEGRPKPPAKGSDYRFESIGTHPWLDFFQKGRSPEKQKPPLPENQEPGITMTVNARKIGTRDTLRLRIILYNLSSSARPKIVFPEGLAQVGEVQTATAYLLAEGRARSSVKYEYSLRATRPGRYRIPAPTCIHEGKTYRSHSLQIKVVPGKILNGPDEPQRPGEKILLLTGQVSLEEKEIGVPFYYRILLLTNRSVTAIEPTKDLLLPGVWQLWYPHPKRISGRNILVDGRILKEYEIARGAFTPLYTGPLTLGGRTYRISCRDDGGKTGTVDYRVPPVSVVVIPPQ